MDYYSILGVGKNASQDDIKKAYRKLAMKHHPDRGGSAEKLQQVNEAYDTLKDPVKRQQYNNPQPRFDSSSMHGGFEGNFEDILNGAFGFGRGPTRSRNQDIRIKVDVTLKEIFSGKSVIVSYRLRNGQEKNVNLDIPPGVKDGDTIRFHDLGDNSLPGRRGDLYVVIKLLKDNEWTRTGDNLTTNAKINCLDLILGTKYVITTLDNRTLELNIPPGTKNGTTFSMHGLGIPNVRTSQRGHLFIKVEATIPQNLNEEQLNTIREVVNGYKTS